MTNADIKRAARGVFEHSAYMNGHGGYSGSLAEKSEAKIHRSKVFDDTQSAYDFVQDELDSNKWGPADVVPVKGKGWFIGGNCSS
ncbi:MAG: hypothetical protein DRO67_04900 [Candidatus Asgardarchaeum californiense]|nr:MAG: hypothetical protein DRO67_04900 [Candidatus Asgardarchaeum californiense]